MSDRELGVLVDSAVARGALLSSRRTTVGGIERPWELNTTWFSACGDVDRFMATQAVLVALRGVPALYLPSFLAAGNDHARVRATGDNRAINRARFDLSHWRPGPAMHRLTHLLKVRRASSAFHPEVEQRLEDLGPSVIAIRREGVLCVTNFAQDPVRLPVSGHDLLSGERFTGTLAPFATAWLHD